MFLGRAACCRSAGVAAVPGPGRGCAVVLPAASCPREGCAWRRAGEHAVDLRHGVRARSNIILFLAFWGSYNKFKSWESVHDPAWTSWAVNLALGSAFALLSAVVYLL